MHQNFQSFGTPWWISEEGSLVLECLGDNSGVDESIVSLGDNSGVDESIASLRANSGVDESIASLGDNSGVDESIASLLAITGEKQRRDEVLLYVQETSMSPFQVRGNRKVSVVSRECIWEILPRDRYFSPSRDKY